MITIRDIFHAFAPESLERSPHLPISHRKVISAIQQCHSGHDGQSLSQCHTYGTHHRVNHSCGNRHCPPCQYETTQQWLHNHLEKQLPGPHFLLTCTVPETLRPFLRSHPPIAYQALFKASATALKRLAHEQRCIGTTLPGFTGVLHTWGRPLQYHPHIHDIVPGGGLSTDRDAWLPSRAHFFGPVKALSPIYRALFKADRRQAGLREQIDPQVWALPWNVHSQANPNGHTSFTYLAPYVFTVAISNSRIVRRTDRTVTFTSRTPDSARPRTINLDAMECSRRFLQHVWPDGCMNVRHCGLLHASCPTSPDTIRPMIALQIDASCPPTPSQTGPPPPCSCPDCGGDLLVVTRVFPCQSAFFDTGEGNHACAHAHVMHPQSPSVEGQGLLRPEHRKALQRGVREAPNHVRQGLISAMRSQQAVTTEALEGTSSRTSPLSPTVR